MITPDLLQNRINNFWGYGSLKSPVWIIGMEEGFHSIDAVSDKKMLERQFSLPIVNGMFDASRPLNSEISDLTNLSPFLPNAKIQRTWEFPITLLMFLKNKIKPNNNEVLDFQRFVLADGKKKEAATIELMPLPSPSTSIWLYNDIQGFETRKLYFKAYKQSRVQGLKELMQKYSPKLIIFYSLTYLREWVEVIGELPDEITNQMYFLKTEKTSFCVIPQPLYLPNAYERLYTFTDKIKDRINL